MKEIKGTRYRWLKRWVLVSFLVLGCGPALPASTSSSPQGTINDFVLEDIDGHPHALSDYLGNKTIVLTFFAMWCEPCKKEMGHLSEMFDARRDDGLMVIAISMDEPETQGMVRPYIKQRNYKFPVLLDTEGRVAGQFNPRKDAPFNIIIDRHQNIVWSKAGYVQGDEKVLLDNISKLLTK